MNESFISLLLALPLISGISPLLFSKVLSKELPSVVWLWIAPIANFLAAIIAFSLLRLVPFKIVLFQWVEIEDIAIQWILNYDALSATLTCVVCSISALVQLYSVPI
jgi:NADH:ubiquinone oxidoreductase subunit 5 (subunit L)/multisubunit Na+/H+ antiporter MnhA subunit